MEHTKLVPVADFKKPCNEVYYMYLPMHAVHKKKSSTSKVWEVFDAAAETASGASLNDHVLVGPTVHSSIINVFLRFRHHRVALTTDTSWMYRAVPTQASI